MLAFWGDTRKNQKIWFSNPHENKIFPLSQRCRNADTKSVSSTMGILNATKAVYNIENLPIKAVKDVLNAIRSNTAVENGKIPAFRVDIDCNWVACKLGGNKCPRNAAATTADFIECLAKYGFIVTPICDGEARHHSKRASVDRVAKKEIARLKLTKARLDLLAVSQQLRDNVDLDVEDRDRLKRQKDELNNFVSKLDKKCVDVGLFRSFSKDLIDEQWM